MILTREQLLNNIWGMDFEGDIRTVDTHIRRLRKKIGEDYIDVYKRQEGGWNLGGKGMTVADFNSFKRSHIQADTKVASDFYHHWKEDMYLMAELGLKMYRFSIAWARIIPDGDGAVNEEGINFYHGIIDLSLIHISSDHHTGGGPHSCAGGKPDCGRGKS